MYPLGAILAFEFGHLMPMNLYEPYTLYTRALIFAIKHHGNQKRKYSGEPYIVHPIAVAQIVRTVTDDEEMIAAALLHDVVEDTPCTLAQIRAEFGDRIAVMVSDLTDVSKPTDGNRARRRAIDRAHTAIALPDSKTIKLADLLHNTDDITKADPDFAVVYMREKALLLPYLKEGHPKLFAAACETVKEYYTKGDVVA